MAPAIRVDNVSKAFRLYHERNQSVKAAIMRRGRARFDEFQALDDVSVRIDAGETFGFVGENGSGKSTLLKCIARILRPDEGHIEVEGKVSALLELGAGFHPELSGRENVYLNGAILGLTRRELDEKFEDIVGFAGLDRFIDSPVKNYSSGMYVRLGFSVAINVNPDVLLVDEVLAVGDEAFQRKCNEKFAEIKESGKTVVIVSHALDTVRSMCDRAMWLEHGVGRAVGPAADVIDQYLGEVHHQRAEETGGTEWGSGEIRLDRVELLRRGRASTRVVRTGDPVTVRLHYTASDPVDNPNFGITVSTVEGLTVSAPNSREAGVELGRLKGSGTVDVEIGALMLLPGTYDVSASITDQAMLHEYHHRHRALRFDVDLGTPHESYGGVVALGGEWRHGKRRPARRG